MLGWSKTRFSQCSIEQQDKNMTLKNSEMGKCVIDARAVQAIDERPTYVLCGTPRQPFFRVSAQADYWLEPGQSARFLAPSAQAGAVELAGSGK
jgi:hypothetical protein